MKKKDKNKPIVNRIEIDEKTAEPIIVEVPENEIESQSAEQEQKTEIKEADFFEENKDLKSAGKQLMMNHLGLNREDDSSIGKRKRIFTLVFKILFIVFVVGALAFTFINDFFGKDNPPLSWEEISSAIANSWYWIFGALGALIACYLTKALKLTVICKPMTGKYHFKTCFETSIIGHYYNYVTPLAIGGQPFEIYHLSRHGVHGGAAAAMPIATYVLNQFSYTILGFIFILTFKYNSLGVNPSLLASFNPTLTVMAIVGVSICMIPPVTIMIFSLVPRFGSKLVRFVMFLGGKLRIVKDPKKATYKTVKNLINNASCLKNMFKHPFSAITCFLLSFLEHFASASIAFFTILTFGFNPELLSGNFFLNWLQIIQFSILLSCAVSFIPTPGNAGAADLSFSFLFEVGLATGLTFTATIAWRIMGYYAFIIIGFIFATLKKRADNKRKNKYRNFQ